MTLGICCNVVLGLIALWQAVRALAWQRIAASAYKQGHDSATAAWQSVRQIEQRYHRVLVARHETFVAGVQRCQSAEVRGSTRAMHQAIHDATVAANQAAAAVSAELKDSDTP